MRVKFSSSSQSRLRLNTILQPITDKILIIFKIVHVTHSWGVFLLLFINFFLGDILKLPFLLLLSLRLLLFFCSEDPLDEVDWQREHKCMVFLSGN